MSIDASTPMRIYGTLGAVDESTRSVEILASTPKSVDGEALVSWDLGRFIKNPVILWSHKTENLPVGKADNVRLDDDGLKMRVTFASCEANPHAEQLWNSVREQTVRTVSVGFEPGKGTTKTVDGKKVVERSANELLEVSFVSVPKDEDARVISASEAGAALARSRVARTDEIEAGFVARYDEGERLAKFDRTATGGAVIPARVARTGILRYLQPDGSIRREYRPPEEVFKADSLATLERVPVIDYEDHRALVTPDTYRQTTRGTAGTGKRDGKYVTSQLFIEDSATLDSIERGDRSDISAGYVCRLDLSPGTFEGEAYDAVQRDIRYNHVALCPPNRGRSGPDVGLRLDSVTVTERQATMKVIKLDGKEYEFGSEAHIEKLDSLHRAELDKLQKRLDEVEGEKDEAKEGERKAREEADSAKKAADDERKKREDEEEQKVREGTRLRRRAERLLSAAREEEDADEESRKKRADEDEKKMDGLSERELMVLSIKAHSKSFDDRNKSIDYVRARFDALEESVKERRGVNGVARVAASLEAHLDRADDDIVDKARRERDEASRNAWRTSAAQKGGK